MLDEPVFSAADWLARHPPKLAPPPSILLTYQRSVWDYARRQPSRKVDGFAADLIVLKRQPVAVAGNFGVGAPATAALAELLAAWGVRRFIGLGLAGGLQPALRAGEIVICDRALRGEGVSAHYLPPGQWAEAAPELVSGVHRALQPHPHHVGASWTTDAPFREKRGAALEHQRTGLLTVEMEAAALYAVARAVNASAVAAFVIADTLANGQWQWNADAHAANASLRILFDAALKCV